VDDQFGVVQVCQSFNDLFKEVLGDIFLEFPPLPDVGEEVSAAAEFHHEAHMLGRFELVEQPHHRRVVALLQDPHFLHYLLFLVFLALEELLVDAFDGHELLTELVGGQIYLPEGAPAKDPADPIELAGGQRRLLELLEVELDHLFQLEQVLRVRRQVRVRAQILAFVVLLVGVLEEELGGILVLHVGFELVLLHAGLCYLAQVLPAESKVVLGFGDEVLVGVRGLLLADVVPDLVQQPLRLAQVRLVLRPLQLLLLHQLVQVVVVAEGVFPVLTGPSGAFLPFFLHLVLLLRFLVEFGGGWVDEAVEAAVGGVDAGLGALGGLSGEGLPRGGLQGAQVLVRHEGLPLLHEAGSGLHERACALLIVEHLLGVFFSLGRHPGDLVGAGGVLPRVDGALGPVLPVAVDRAGC